MKIIIIKKMLAALLPIITKVLRYHCSLVMVQEIMYTQFVSFAVQLTAYTAVPVPD